MTDDPDGECPLCAMAEPTDIGHLFDAVNLSLTGFQLSEYENLGALKIGEGKLDLRKLLALLLGEEFYTRPDGRMEKTPDIPGR